MKKIHTIILVIAIAIVVTMSNTVSAQCEPIQAAGELISVDIAWEGMTFTYGGGSLGTWNSTTHMFENQKEDSWSQNKATVTVSNHSNVSVQVDFDFVADAEGVIGDFSKNSVILDCADETSIQFGIDSRSKAITQNQKVGHIRVRISTYKGMPTWPEESNIFASGTIGFTDTGRYEWTTGDELLARMSYVDQSQPDQYFTLKYDGTKWTGAESVRYADKDKVMITAWYAPCYQWCDGQMILKEGKVAGTEEFVSGTGSIEADGRLSISFKESKRDYFRFRFATLPAQKLQVYVVDFTPAGPTGAVAPDWYNDEYYSIQADANGNAYLYGTFSDLKSGDISLFDEDGEYIAGWIFELSESAIGTSYAFEANAPLQIADHVVKMDVSADISDTYFKSMVEKAIKAGNVTEIKICGRLSEIQQRILAQQLSNQCMELDLGLMGKDEIIPELMENSQLTITYGYEKRDNVYHIYDGRGIQGAVDDLKKTGSDHPMTTMRMERNLLLTDGVAASSLTNIGALIEQGKIIIDLNGYTMQSNGLAAIIYLSSSAEVTVTDSSEAQTGKIKTVDGMQSIVVRGGAFTLEKGAIESDGYCIECEDGFVTINGGTLQAGSHSAGIFYNVENKLGKITINDGQIIGDRAAIVAYWNALEINGGTFTGESALEMNLYQESTLTAKITGGTFIGTEYDISTNQTGILQGGTFPDGFKIENTDVNRILVEGYGYVDAAGDAVTTADGQTEITGTVSVKAVQ